jgi:hypothetical protein
LGTFADQPTAEEVLMATNPATDLGSTPARRGGGPAARSRLARLTTETKAAYKTTELMAYLAVLIGVLIAGIVVDNADGSGSFGADKVWLYATILTVGYMVSRGLAKSGSREPYDAGSDSET